MYIAQFTQNVTYNELSYIFYLQPAGVTVTNSFS